MTEYTQSAEEALNDSIKDAYVLAVTAKQGRLNVKAADELAGRLRSHADRMVDDGDREMLRTAADGFERISLRIKAGGAPTRDKSSNGSRTGSRPAPVDYLALSRAQDLERMGSAGSPFSVNGHEVREAARAAEANRLLRERQRRHEAQRAAQVARDAEPKGPGR